MFMPKRRSESHKGDYGHLLILGGSPGLTGAVCLAARAALRSGCGLVTVGIPAGLNMILEVKLTEAMSLPLADTQRGTFSLRAAETCLDFISKKADGVVIGPGISTEKETSQFVKKVISGADKPVIIDADAIKIISGNKDILRHIETVGSILTPHPGEMAYLTGETIQEIQRTRQEKAISFAKEYKTVVVLKGHNTVVTDGSQLYVNLTGNPGMATAGSGDVLAGIIGSLLVQGYDCFQSAKKGVYIHGLAGDFALKEKGETSLISSDIIESLPDVFQYLVRLN